MDSNVNIFYNDLNHIYFYDEINSKTCLILNSTLRNKANELLNIYTKNNVKEKIYLHINSSGGELFNGISTMDTILLIKNQIDIVTIVEGIAESAATLLSIVGTQRLITKNSFMMIHQMYSDMSGKYSEFKDYIINYDKTMELIKNIYTKYTKIQNPDIDELLKHEYWLNADECLNYGLVDEII